MAILSVNLAFGRWSDLGIVVLERGHDSEAPVACEITMWNEPGPVLPEVLAGRLNHMCGVRGVRTLLLDGPQAWKSRENGLAHARVSEKQLNTAAKTGLPGMVKPRTTRAFAEFCVDVCTTLCAGAAGAAWAHAKRRRRATTGCWLKAVRGPRGRLLESSPCRLEGGRR
jgi:hypothetical protein